MSALVDVLPDGVAIHADENDTYNWARKPGACWPCSELSGKSVAATFDRSGLLYLRVSDDERNEIEDVPSNEFNAFCADVCRKVLPKDHPCWFVIVGQFE